MGVIVSRAPVRINDIGGFTDTWFSQGGAVLNFAIDRYIYVRIYPHKKETIRISSENFGIETEIHDPKNIEYNGELDLLKAVIKRLGISRGMNISIKAEVPPGCGTGTSASVAVSLITALSHIKNKVLNPHQKAKLAHKLETEELNLESGVQDQYAASFGGINFMKVNYPNVKITPIKVDNSLINELNKRLILVYLSSRSSTEMHKAVIKKYKKRNQSTLESFKTLEECAYQMKNALNAKNIEEIPVIMNKNWNTQKKLHSKMTNKTIQKLEKLVFSKGGVGFKCNGAGGGGSVTIFSARDKENQLKDAIQNNGFKIIPFKLDFDGAKIIKNTISS
jgi:D-glycero-alpha-D-manno-heptose-7-phosphate kinase